MRRRSHRRRKQFDCGHQGYGKYCHYCKQQRDGHDFRRDRGITKGKIKEEKEEMEIQAEQDRAKQEQDAAEAEAQLEAEGKWAEQQEAEEEEKLREEYQEPPPDFGGE